MTSNALDPGSDEAATMARRTRRDNLGPMDGDVTKDGRRSGVRHTVLANAVLLVALGCSRAGYEDLPGGVKRVTLTVDGYDHHGDGWNLAKGRVAEDAGDADFYLFKKMVIGLGSDKPQVGFCRKLTPEGSIEFTRVEDIPVDIDGCNWLPAQLGGNHPEIASYAGGRGFLVRDASATPVARLRTVAASIDGNCVTVIFDILGL